MLADHTKWGVVGIASIARLDQADVLVTDSHLEAEVYATLAAHVGRIVVAHGGAQGDAAAPVVAGGVRATPGEAATRAH